MVRTVPVRIESPEDTYLLDPPLAGLSVKIRGDGVLEVKAYRGRPGILEVAGGNDACAKATFAEQVPGLTTRYGRRTCGLDGVLQAVALALGGSRAGWPAHQAGPRCCG